VRSLFFHQFYFFFSSRRRHTRSKRDWSSDVCSSDLATKYHIPKKKRKAFSNPVGMKPSLIKEAPLPNIERKMKSKPNNSYCKAFAAFVLLFLFLFFLAN